MVDIALTKEQDKVINWIEWDGITSNSPIKKGNYYAIKYKMPDDPITKENIDFICSLCGFPKSEIDAFAYDTISGNPEGFDWKHTGNYGDIIAYAKLTKEQFESLLS